MSAHTPGPWHVHADGVLVLSGRAGSHRAVVDCETSSDPLMGQPEREANALLISAAPDLLEALKEAIETCAFMDQATDDERLTDGDCLNRWKAAIAKAEGRQ